jgi:ribosomal-protein-alanine N-acetyltransferase
MVPAPFNDLIFRKFPTLETPRLQLRKITGADETAVFRIFSDPRVNKYLGHPPFLTFEEAAFWVRTVQSSLGEQEGIRWALECRDTGSFIGSIGYWRILKQHFRAEIGYELAPAFWGKGYMDEALKAILQFGFETMQLHSVEANVTPANKSSLALLHRNGFIEEGFLKENYYGTSENTGQPGFLDTVSLSLINPATNVSPLRGYR